MRQGSMFRMSPEELQEYLKGKRNRVFAKKKGRGSYTRKEKHRKVIVPVLLFFNGFPYIRESDGSSRLILVSPILPYIIVTHDRKTETSIICGNKRRKGRMKMLKRSELTACIDDPVCEECQDADCKNCRRYYAPAHNNREVESDNDN